MGDNTAIKKYRARPAQTHFDALDGPATHLPIVRELLASPWIVRAADLENTGDADAVRRIEEPVGVLWDADSQRPQTFFRGKQRYPVDEIIQIWAVDQGWWDPRACISRRYWRVISRGGTYDLAYERRTSEWLLVGIQD